MSDYEFEMPWPPTVNHYHQPVRIGKKGARIVKGEQAKKYAKDMEVHLESIGIKDERIPEDQPLSVHLTLNPPTMRKYDVDNRAKGVLDALSNANFYADDSQIQSLTIVKGVKTPPGNVLVKVTKL